jgi:hypothetical protein
MLKIMRNEGDRRNKKAGNRNKAGEMRDRKKELLKG